MAEHIKYALNKLKETWKAHGREIGLFAGVFLVGIVGFEIGLVEGQSMQSKPLVIEVPAKPSPVAQVAGVSSEQKEIQKTVSGEVLTQTQNTNVDQNCTFVGSKNSDKYHLSTCAVVKRIKPENRRCFVSEEDAKSKGYVAGCLK
ncbi:MAG: hypothetical protein PHT88_01575 [Candidatus Moranbacteria bacterium]|nr:hypothetical protein [Candidatus Moranbacteria bacterium]